MPDEEESTAAVEAEPEATAGPEADTNLTDLVTEGDTGVPAEQEGEPEGEPGAKPEQEAESSFEAALETAKGQVEGLKESDPEQYEKLSKLFGGDDIVAQKAGLDQEKAQLIAAVESQAAFAGVQQAYEPARTEAQGRMANFGNAVAQQINKAVQETGGQPTTSGPRIAAVLQEEIGKAENTGRATGLAESFLEARTAALTSTLGAQLTTAELTEIGGLTWPDAVSNPQQTYRKLFDIVLKAAVRAAPEEAVKQGVSKAKATKEAATLLENLVGKIAKNGKAAVAPAPAKQTFEELEHLYAVGEATPTQEAEYRRARTQRGLE